MSIAERAPVSLFIMSFAQQYFTAVAQSVDDRNVSKQVNSILEDMVHAAIAEIEAVPIEDASGAESAVAGVAMSSIEALASVVGFGDAEVLYGVAAQHLEHQPLVPYCGGHGIHRMH